MGPKNHWGKWESKATPLNNLSHVEPSENEWESEAPAELTTQWFGRSLTLPMGLRSGLAKLAIKRVDIERIFVGRRLTGFRSIELPLKFFNGGFKVRDFRTGQKHRRRGCLGWLRQFRITILRIVRLSKRRPSGTCVLRDRHRCDSLRDR